MYDFQRLQDKEYSRNQLIISQYSDGVGHVKYKLVFMQTLKNSGVEKSPEDLRYFIDNDSKSEYGNLLVLPGDVVDSDGDILCSSESGNVSKLPKNVYRSRNTIYELAFCNPWQWFFTGTIDGGKHDRTNLDDYRKKLSQMIRNYNRNHGLDIKYLIVPELHEDRKNWHVHGFLSGLPVEHLHQFQLGDKMSKYIAKKIAKGRLVYSWERYQKSFGFCDLEPIASHDGACKYVTKYISKSLDHSVSDIGKHLYYASQGLDRRKRVFTGDIPERVLDFMNHHPHTYRGDYCACLWLDSLDSISSFLPVKNENAVASSDGNSIS